MRGQVRVWLGDRADPGCHSHVLSRFLIARTLMATQVHFSTAVKVALEVKKHLVDTDQLDVSQAQLESAIFKFMRRRSLPEDCIFQYKLLSAFHQRRQALIVLIAGGVLCHKSTISAQLAQRMNLGNVLNVDCVARLVLPLDAGAGVSDQQTSQSSSLGADGPNPAAWVMHACSISITDSPASLALRAHGRRCGRCPGDVEAGLRPRLQRCADVGGLLW